jgi:hypothetical protein
MIRLAGNVACMGGTRYWYKILVGISQDKTDLKDVILDSRVIIKWFRGKNWVGKCALDSTGSG